jgi:acyl carrier protein
MTDIASDVTAIIAKKARVEASKIELSDRLEDLGLESLDAVELIFDLEEKFDIQIPYNANDPNFEFDTVGEVVSAIERVIGKKKS